MADLAPFSCSFTKGFPELLHQLKCSIAISTYQAGKVIFISAKDDGQLIQLPRSFSRPMGIAFDGAKMAIATKKEVVVLNNVPGVHTSYPKKPSVYDALYVPRATFYTGPLDIHDLHWLPKGLLAVNTSFSCLAYIGGANSFAPIWRPPFVDRLLAEDFCHLNGLAMIGEQPAYVTVLGQTNSAQGWRKGKATGGALLDVRTNEVLLSGLPMPHSPRIYDNNLFILLSATGEVVKVDLSTRKYEVIQRLNGFVRGLDRLGDYIFVGLSKLRTTSQSFGDLPIAASSVFSGVVAIHLPSGKVVAHIKYEASVEEIFDVKVMANQVRPGILNHMKDEHTKLVSYPSGHCWLDDGKEEPKTDKQEED